MNYLPLFYIEILKFRNIGRSKFGRFKCSPPYYVIIIKRFSNFYFNCNST